MKQALAANPNLPAAQAALRQAQENVAAQRGYYYPTVSAGLNASRNLTPTASVSPASATGNPYYSLITPQLNISFVPDVFGSNRRAVESLQAQADNQRFMLEATWLTLTSNVVAGAIQEASLRGQVAATEDAIRVETDLLAILRKQQALGQAAGADVAAQEAALAQAQLNLPPLQKQLAQQRDALTALAGRYPSQEIEQTFDLASLEMPIGLAGQPAVRSGEATARMCARRRRTCTSPAPISARRSPPACRRSRCPPRSATAPTACRTCSRPGPISGPWPAA